MLRLFCAITGDNYTLARQDTPASKRKISALASVVLIPVVIWFLIGYSIANTILLLDTKYALAIGLFAATIILTIERVVLMAGSNRWFLALRIFLGLLIAFLGALFFDEIIFKEDIDQQLFLNQRELIEVANNNAKTASAIELEAAREKVDMAYEKWIQAVDETRRESDGTGGSGVRGISDITILKISLSEKLEDEYAQAKSKLEQLEQNLQNRLKKVEDEIPGKINGNSIILRIKLLFKLVTSDRFILLFYCCVSLFLFLLEFIVIIAKYSFDETSYEKRIKAQELIVKRRIENMINDDVKLHNSYEKCAPVVSARHALHLNKPGLFMQTDLDTK